MRNPFTRPARAEQPDMDARLRAYKTYAAHEFADAIEASAPPQCAHNVRKSCPACQARQQALADARLVRAAGEAAL